MEELYNYIYPTSIFSLLIELVIVAIVVSVGYIRIRRLLRKVNSMTGAALVRISFKVIFSLSLAFFITDGTAETLYNYFAYPYLTYPIAVVHIFWILTGIGLLFSKKPSGDTLSYFMSLAIALSLFILLEGNLDSLSFGTVVGSLIVGLGVSGFLSIIGYIVVPKDPKPGNKTYVDNVQWECKNCASLTTVSCYYFKEGQELEIGQEFNTYYHNHSGKCNNCGSNNFIKLG